MHKRPDAWGTPHPRRQLHYPDTDAALELSESGVFGHMQPMYQLADRTTSRGQRR